MDEKHVLDTILHEIAHALVGSHHKHDAVWKAKCKEIGCDPKATSDVAVEVEPKWVLVFDGKIYNKWHRRPNKSTFARLPHTWVKGKKGESYGKCVIMEYKEYAN